VIPACFRARVGGGRKSIADLAQPQMPGRATPPLGCLRASRRYGVAAATVVGRHLCLCCFHGRNCVRSESGDPCLASGPSHKDGPPF